MPGRPSCVRSLTRSYAQTWWRCGTFSPSQRQNRATRLWVARQPSRRNTALARRMPVLTASSEWCGRGENLPSRRPAGTALCRPVQNSTWTAAVLLGVRDAEFRHVPALRKRYWGQHLWARGYYCASVGAVDEATIRDYIENQRWDEDVNAFKITGPTEP